MAGGKQSPRQAMINMMYLVLTALLALQVSNSVLERFIFINKSLEISADRAADLNQNTIVRIEKAVKESGNAAEDVKVVEKAKKVRTETDKVIQQLTDLKEQMVDITGGRDEDQKIIGAKDQDQVANLMINQGRGEELRKWVNDYAQFLSVETGLNFDDIARDGKDIPEFANDKNQKNKDFPTLFFESTPTAAGMATVSEFQTKIRSYETQALEKLARDVGAQNFEFDQLTPVVLPESKVVASGTEYVADLFLSASSQNLTPTMTLNGRELKVEEGKGKIRFPVSASANEYDENGFATRRFEAEITIKQAGKDSAFTKTFEYVVARPVIQVQSASVQALYLNCGNDLQINVPALGSTYNPTFSADGATVIPGQGGAVKVVPNKASVSLKVSSNGTFIGTEKFPVRRLPKPSIELTSRGRPVNIKQGVPVPGPRSLTLKAVADESIQQFLPKDARYRVSEWEVILGRGPRAVKRQVVNGPDVNLTQFAQLARPGDRIVIEVKEVQRRNFRDEIEKVNIPSTTFNIPLN